MSTKTYDVLYAEYSEGARLSLDLDSFLSIGKRLLDEFNMVTYIDQNIREYGLDDLSNEIIQTQLDISVGKEELLPAVEGFIDGLINAIKSFFRKIGELFSRFFRWIGSLFGRTSEKYTEAKEECKKNMSSGTNSNPHNLIELNSAFDASTKEIFVLPWRTMHELLKGIEEYAVSIDSNFAQNLEKEYKYVEIMVRKEATPVDPFYFDRLPTSKYSFGIEKTPGKREVVCSRPEIYDTEKPIVSAGFSFAMLYNLNDFKAITDKSNRAIDKITTAVLTVQEMELILLRECDDVKDKKKFDEIQFKLSSIRVVMKILKHLTEIGLHIGRDLSKVSSEFAKFAKTIKSK